MPDFNLFSQQDASSTFNHLLDEITREVKSKNPDYILNINADEWEQYFIDKYEFIPLKLYPEKATVEFSGKRIVPFEQFGRRFEREEYILIINVPFTGSSCLLRLRPSRFVMRTVRVDAPNGNEGNITLQIVLNEQNPNQFEREKNSFLSYVQKNVPNINNDAEGFNKKIAPHFRSILKAEQEKIKKEISFFEAINVKIDKRTEGIFQVPTIKKKSIPEPKLDSNSQKKYVQVPSFSNELYGDVLKVIYDFFKNVEKKPSIYKNKDEESLRDYLLPVIETRYVSTSVTGETFNKGGKTDILLKYQDGTNLFVAECKIWNGKAHFHDTINQLFDRYLTWRDSKVAIIIFVRNKDFSAVLETIKKETREHPYFFRENGERGESSFSYIFHFPGDSQKLVYTEIMAFSFNQ